VRFLQFETIYTEKIEIPNEWRNAVITPVFNKGDRKEPQNYRGISILKICYKILSKILNTKLQKHSAVSMTETQNAFRKEQSCTDPTFWLTLLMEKRMEFNLEPDRCFRL